MARGELCRDLVCDSIFLLGLAFLRFLFGTYIDSALLSMAL